MFEGVEPNFFLEGCFFALRPSFYQSTHSLHNCQCNDSKCFRRMKIPFVILYVMMPFLNPTLGAIGPQKIHLKCLGWLEVEFTSEEDKQLGAKKAQAMAFSPWAFQKSHYFANVTHCWFAFMVLEFVTDMVFIIKTLTNVDVQISKYNYGYWGKQHPTPPLSQP